LQQREFVGERTFELGLPDVHGTALTLTVVAGVVPVAPLRPADGRLHAAGQRPDSPRLGTATAEAKDRTAEQEKRVKVIQQKLDRLDEAFLFAQSIDATSYERQRDRLREEQTRCISCSFRKGSRTTEFDSIEPPQRRHFSTTWRRIRVLKKFW
jgi:hypothetical protein